MKKTTFLIVGKHAVIEALKNPSRKIERIFLTEDAKKKINRENQSLNLLKNVHVFYKSKKELDNLCGKDETSHQGLIAEVEQLEEITLKEFIYSCTQSNINLIALEDVTDPRNIGSIIRSAAAFNVQGIIVKDRSFPSKSKLLYKSASGGTEYLKIFKVSNVNTALKFLKTKNFWISSFDSKAKKDFTNHKWEGKKCFAFWVGRFRSKR
jgi:23S rRNA (guanosine2251-2'-O)-methyltransferase